MWHDFTRISAQRRSRPPVWSGASWSSAGALGSAGCWWLGVPAPRVFCPSLF